MAISMHETQNKKRYTFGLIMVLSVFSLYLFLEPSKVLSPSILPIFGIVVLLYGVMITGNPRATTVVLFWSPLIFGLLLFVFTPILVSNFALLALAVHFAVDGYQPRSVYPRYIAQKNFQSFAIVSLMITNLLLLLISGANESIELKMSQMNLAILISSVFFLLNSLYLISIRAYDRIQGIEARKEKDWTNNIFTLLSHNIKTPIAALAGRIEIIEQKFTRGIPINQNDIEDLKSVNHKVMALVNSLMNSSSKVIIQQGSTAHHDIESILSLYEKRYSTVQLQIENVSFELVSTMKIALELTLESLLSNSEKYGANEILISLVEEGQNFNLTVTDNGEGMDELALERYGTPFNTVNSRKGGSGIGVYFAVQLIENGGWSWNVKSTLGTGTSVTITIPKQTVIV